MPKYQIKADVPFVAWSETTHAARCMRELARNTPSGYVHIASAAVVMTAFSIEAFIQTIGPEAFGDQWSAPKNAAERLPLRKKLAHIGKYLGEEISYDVSPWSEVDELIKARDRLAHPKPDTTRVVVEFEADSRDAAQREASRQIRGELHPLSDINRLDQVAKLVEDALLDLWIKANRDPYVLKTWEGPFMSLREVS